MSERDKQSAPVCVPAEAEISSDCNSFSIQGLQRIRACCIPKPNFEVRDLTVSYSPGLGKDSFPILKSVSLDIYRGCVTAIVGPSGCGKSTFLLALSRLLQLKDQVQITGSVVFEGCNIYRDPEGLDVLRREVGIVFQKPVPFPVSIFRNLEIPLRERGIKNRSELLDKIEKALVTVGLWNEVNSRLHSPAAILSGGQLQRLCIARALVLNPSVLLMDEPCSSLDPVSSGVVEDLIKELRGKHTIVLVTHNLAQAKRVANYMALFWSRGMGGEVLDSGEIERVFSNPQCSIAAGFLASERAI